MASDKVVDWEVGSVSEAGVIAASGGFDGDLVGTGTLSVGSSATVTTFGGATVNLGAETTGTIQFTHGGATLVVKMSDLPTADPTVAGQLWRNSNVLTVSTGS